MGALTLRVPINNANCCLRRIAVIADAGRGLAWRAVRRESPHRLPVQPRSATRSKCNSIDEVKKRMIANQDKSARIYEATPEEEALLARSGAPTLRNLRAAAEDLFATILVEPAPAMLDVSHPAADFTPDNNK